MDDLTPSARALLFRTLAFAAGLLVVTLAGLWILLNHFVARPLRDYSQRAHEIASGAPVRMNDLGGDEFAKLGTAINSMADTLREQATVDALTGLFNLRHFDGEFPKLMRDAEQTSRPLALINVDVDNLKPVNDTYGHAAGDLVLQAIGNCLLEWANGRYTCWRTGGDEFAAAIPKGDSRVAQDEVRRLSEMVEATPLEVDGTPIHLSISVGFAVTPSDARTVDDLTTIADQRMYEQKVEARARDAA
jgi:diguanylate cyclase (GGDEF)-like protein